MSSSTISSQSSSTNLLSTSSSSFDDNLNNLAKLIFIGNDGIVKGYMEKEGWEQIGHEEANNSSIVCESKTPFAWLYKQTTNQLSQVELNNGITTINTINNIANCKSLSTCPISGNNFILSNKEQTISNNSIYSGALNYYLYFNKVSGILSPIYNKNTYNFFGSMDMVLDYVRGKLWIADTLNNKIVSINTTNNNIDYVFDSGDYFFPSSLSLDTVSGTLFVRLYKSTTFEEVIALIKNNNVISIYKSPGIVGLKNVCSTDEIIVAIDKKTSQSCAYGIDINNGLVEKTYICQKQNINLLSSECLNNTFITYDANGMIRFSLYNGERIGNINIDFDNRFKIIPSIFESSYWGYVYRQDGKHNLSNIKLIGANKILINNGTATFNLPVNGSIIVGERKPIVLIDSGKTIIKLSNNANTIEKTKRLVLSYDIIDTHIKNNVIVISKKGCNYIKILNYDFSQEVDYITTNNIIDIVISQSEENCYWVLYTNQLDHVRLESGTITVLSSISITPISVLKGVKYDYHDNGAIIFSDKEIYKINEDGATIRWQNNSFEEIVDIVVSQNISKIYTEQFKYDLLSTKSMAFDSFRNKMWWLTNENKPKLCSIDLSNYSADLTNIELQNVSIESSLDDKLKVPYSLSVDCLTGNPIVVFQTENNHVVLQEFEKTHHNIVFSKNLPDSFNNGFLYVEKTNIGELPFSFYSLGNRNDSTLLPFEFNTEFDAEKFTNSDNKNNVIYIPPNPKNENNVIIPNPVNFQSAIQNPKSFSTDSNNVDIEIWTNDTFEVKNVQICNLENMSYSAFSVPTETYNLPSFSWDHHTYLFSDQFSSLTQDGDLTIYKYEKDKKELIATESISCVLDYENSNYKFSNFVYCPQNSSFFVNSSNSIIKINGSKLDISKVFYNTNSNLYCCDNSTNLWGINENKNILKMDSFFNTYTYDTIAYPIKMMFSEYNQSLFIIADKTFYRFEVLSQILKVVDQVESYLFKDFTIYKSGMIAILLKNQKDETKSIIKILNPDLTIKKMYNFSNETVLKMEFSSQGILFYLSEKGNRNYITYCDVDNNFVYSQDFDRSSKDHNPNLLYYPKSNAFLIFGSNGNILSCSDTIIDGKLNISNIYESKNGFGSVSYAPRHLYVKKLEQLKVRAFVGSRLWQSDRWDSGEIESDKTEILYGGGNNLLPGQKYFFHVSVYYKDYGWSNIQIKEFTTPK